MSRAVRIYAITQGFPGIRVTGMTLASTGERDYEAGPDPAHWREPSVPLAAPPVAQCFKLTFKTGLNQNI
jgi:hypothetical protein